MSDPTTKTPLLDLESVAFVVGNSTRWTILKQLCDGEGYGATDFAGILGCTSTAASKHLQILVKAGICVRGRGKLYRIAPGFQPEPGKKQLDFGHCLLRLDFQPVS
jgi:hypothetical protein